MQPEDEPRARARRTEAEVQAATDHLRTLSLVIESSGGRVMRYAHNVERVLAMPTQAVALIAALMLRGRADVGRIAHRNRAAASLRRHFAVEGFLEELAARRQVRW
jgi:uncharacterized protein YceH (UPF0502 family)